MSVASVALFVVLGQVPSTDPFDLISQLGDPHYADRQRATTTLERLGRLSLPALRSARERRDPEVRTRAALLLARIEGALLTQPSVVRLSFQDTPLAEAVRSFGDQASVRLTLLDEDAPHWRDRKVTLHDPEPLPFWKALDRFCDAARLQYNFGTNAVRNGRGSAFPLFDGNARNTTPVSDSGPFRVSLVTIHYQSDTTFPPDHQLPQGARRPVPPGGPRGELNEQFYAQMQIAVEPRLSLTQSGPPKLIEAEDDKGNSLVPPSAGNADLRNSGYFGFSTGPVIPVQASLERPSLPGNAIKRLKGVVPITVSDRKPNPLVVPLPGPSGRTFQNEDVVVTVHEVRGSTPNRPPVIDLTVRPNTGTGTAATLGGIGNDGGAGRHDVHQQHLEVIDGQGRTIPWYQSSLDAEAGRFSITLTSPEQAATATELRYYSLIRATTEVPFEFHDVRMR